MSQAASSAHQGGVSNSGAAASGNQEQLYNPASRLVMFSIMVLIIMAFAMWKLVDGGCWAVMPDSPKGQYNWLLVENVRADGGSCVSYDYAGFSGTKKGK